MALKKISKIHQRVAIAKSHHTGAASRAMNRMVADGMTIDRSADSDILSKVDQTWDDLNSLRETLANTVMEFTGQVYSMINNQDVLNVLGDKRPQFDKLVSTFFADTQHFSGRVAQMRAQHEHLTGSFATLDDYSLFTKLSMEYQNANDELNTLLAPTLSEMMLIVHEQTSRQLGAVGNQLTDPTVISDIEAKQV